MKFAIIGNNYQREKSAEIKSLLQILHEHQAEIEICEEFYTFLTQELNLDLQSVHVFHGDDFSADMVISIGGDGTFLKAAHRTGKKNIPVLGINTGRLGFLADISPLEFRAAFEAIHQGNYTIEQRSVIQVTTDNGTPIASPYALNDIAVLKRDSSSMICIRTSIDGTYLNTYQADGLIIATPTGSTAYSLSVNGPIMVPSANTLSINPVAPHSLNIRPIVIYDNCEIKLEVKSRSHNFLVAIDGRSYTCNETSHLTIRKAPYTIKVAKCLNHNFFNTLRTKLMWGADTRSF